jgi:Transposase DDE domain
MQNNIKFNDSITSITKSIQNFSTFINNICTDCNYEYLYRIKKTNLTDILTYRLLYTRKSATKLEVAGDISFFKHKKITDRTFDNRDNQIPISFYDNTFDKISAYASSQKKSIMLNVKQIIVDHDIYVVDGTDIHLPISYEKEGYVKHNENYILAISIGIYNIIENAPICLYTSKCTSERKAFSEAINEITIKPNNIFVFDALYFTQNFAKEAYHNKMKYIIKLPIHLNIITDNFTNDNINDVGIDYDIDNTIIKLRIVKYRIENKSYYLITNLLDIVEFSVDILKQIYVKRWDIETYFRQIKDTTKFDEVYEQKEEKVKKGQKCVLIVSQIISYIECLFDNKYSETGKKINRTLLTKKIYDKLLINIIQNKDISEQLINDFYVNYIKYIPIVKNRHVVRICKRPNKRTYKKNHLYVLHEEEKKRKIEKQEKRIMDKKIKKEKLEEKKVEQKLKKEKQTIINTMKKVLRQLIKKNIKATAFLIKKVTIT